MARNDHLVETIGDIEIRVDGSNPANRVLVRNGMVLQRIGGHAEAVARAHELAGPHQNFATTKEISHDR